MLKCPFCNFENEEGALFCEQCKSDLSQVESAPKAGGAGSGPGRESVPVAAVLEDTVPIAAPIEEDDAVMAEAAPMPLPQNLPASPGAGAAATPAAPGAAPPTPPAAEPAPVGQPLPAGAQPKLVVLRGQKIGAEYPIYPDLNFIGRADEKPVDVDLEDQEPPDRVWTSRQHALITLENGMMTIEDLNSANGTYVNRTRVYPGQKRPLNVNDVIQIGTVQMKVKT